MNINDILSVLEEDEKRFLKDVINTGAFCTSNVTFLDKHNNIVSNKGYGYHVASATLYNSDSLHLMSSLLYKKLCNSDDNHKGELITHEDRWLCDSPGDILFVNDKYHEDLKKWVNGN